MGTGDSYETIVVKTSDGVSTITLNRPDPLNAFHEVLKAELLDARKNAERSDSLPMISKLPGDSHVQTAARYCHVALDSIKAASQIIDHASPP